MKRTAIIMAGGAGERFWPLSRRKKPKQLLKLETDKTMLEQSIDRISPLIPIQDIYIITSELLLSPIREAIPALPPENVIAEPSKRNTAPCLALGAAFIAAKYKGIHELKEISVAVLTADQSIKPVEGFIITAGTALEYVENNYAIATIGIQPGRPDTGYGYIEVDAPFSKESTQQIKPVIRFHEKPDVALASKYLEMGNFIWNSGMFFWRLDVFREEMINHLPEVGSKIDAMIEQSIGNTNVSFNSIFTPAEEIFNEFPDISIDFGLMEKSANVVVGKADFLWDDIGSWDSLDRIRSMDENSNILEGKVAGFNLKNTTILNASGNDEIIVAGIGLDNLVVVVTDDAVLVCNKDQVQDVKKCLQIIKENKGEKWL
jgi:mannose-1-phosphate guanylyltransferase